MSKEAMKLALLALEGCEDVTADVLKAITAIREALASEAIEQKSGIKQVIELYDSPDQPSQQELVAFEEWLAKQHGDPEEIGFLQALRIAYIAGQDSITSPPPQRIWVGLTDEEVKHQWEVWRANVPRYTGFAKGIEAKLKEKNT